MRLLICEDEVEIIRHLREVLSSIDFEVIYLDEMDKIDRQLASPSWIPEVVVLDRLFGNDDLITYLQSMKKVWPLAKILILSAIDTPLEKASALERGADDYLAKPFFKEELIARIKALNRRSAAVPSEITIRQVHLDLNERKIEFQGQSADLSLKECELLKLFFSHPGQVFSKDEIVQNVWKSSPGLETNTVEATLVRVRRKIQDLGAPIQIKNTRFVGYWLEE